MIEKYVSNLVNFFHFYWKTNNDFQRTGKYPMSLEQVQIYLFNFATELDRIDLIFKMLYLKKIKKKYYTESKDDYDVYFVLNSLREEVVNVNPNNSLFLEKNLPEYLSEIISRGFSGSKVSSMAEVLLDLRKSYDIKKTQKIIEQIKLRRESHLALFAFEELIKQGKW